MAHPPSLNGKSRTQFRKGNPGGPGNPLAKRCNELRAALVKAVNRDDVEKIVAGLVERAKAGDVNSARELFDRLFGKAKQPLSLTGDVAKAARAITAAFDHARYAEMFRQNCGDGQAASTPHRN